MLGTPRCNGGPLARVIARGPAQPEPSPSPAFHHRRHRDWLWLWHPQPVWHWRNRPAALVCCGCVEGQRVWVRSQRGSFSVSPATLPCPHCLTLALTFSLPQLTKPSSLRLVSPRPPLSSDFPGSQGCTLCSELGFSTRTAFLSVFAKLGLYGQARRRTAPQYPSEKESSDIQVPLYPRCAVGKVWIQRPVSPLVCGFGWATPPISNLPLPAPCRRVYSPFCLLCPVVPCLASRGWPILCPGRSHLSDSQRPALCPGPAWLPCGCTK